MENKDIYTIDEIAQKLSVKPVTVREYVKAGTLKVIRLSGRTLIRIRHEDYLNFIKSNN